MEIEGQLAAGVLDSAFMLAKVNLSNSLIVSVNAKMAQWLGTLNVAHYANLPLNSLWPNTNNAAWQTCLDQLSQDLQWEGELPLITTTKKHKWAHVKAIKLNQQEALLFCTDISGHKQEAPQNREYLERLADVTMAAPEYIWELDTAQQTVYMSPKAVNVLGYPVQELHKIGLLALMAPDDAEEYKKLLVPRLKNQQNIENIELRVKHANGHDVWLLVNGKPFYNAQNNWMGHRGSCLDISALKKAEQAVQARERRLSSLIDSQTNYVIRTDLEGRFTYINKAFENHYGMLPGHLIGHPYINTIVPEDFDKCQQMAMQCITNPGKIVPLVIRKPNGKGGILYTEWEFIGILDHQGEVVEIQGVGKDITNQVKGQQIQDDYNKQLVEIARISSHDIRGPVASILGLVSLFNNKAPNNPGNAQLIAMIENSAKNLDLVIHKIVEMTYQVEKEQANS